MKNNLSKKGFTLVEVLTVLFVMSLGLIGILSLIVQNIQSQNYNKGNLIAYQLAQEGIELVRRVRDDNWRDEFPYSDKLAPGGYYMDYNDAAPTTHNPANPEELLLNQDEFNFYIHGTTVSSTPFSRLITIEGINSHSFRVISQVSWGEHGRSYSYDLETVLYDWR